MNIFTNNPSQRVGIQPQAVFVSFCHRLCLLFHFYCNSLTPYLT